MSERSRTLLGLVASLVAAGALAGCASGSQERSGRGFLGIGGGERAERAEAEIGVNSLLWRATLDTLAFMPLESQDPWGGVIVTEWFNNPELANERFKATVYILDTRLRADALRVVLHRQVLTANGWLNAEVDPATSVQIENAILTRARELRLSTNEG